MARGCRSFLSTKALQTNSWKPNSSLRFWNMRALEPVFRLRCVCTKATIIPTSSYLRLSRTISAGTRSGWASQAIDKRVPALRNRHIWPSADNRMFRCVQASDLDAVVCPELVADGGLSHCLLSVHEACSRISGFGRKAHYDPRIIESTVP